MKPTPLSPDAQLLRALREAGDDFTAPADLAEQNSLSATALRRRIAALRELGYEIESDPHHGLRLLAAPDALYADDLRSRLPGSLIIGREIHVYEKTASTNDVLERLARDGVKEGVVVFAEHQTRGRGRLGRDWFAPARKALCFSVLLRPPFGPQAVTRVTVTAATAVARGIESSAGLATQIKWPNDILLRGRKTAGILTELRGELDQVRYILLGIGINVNLRASDFPAALRAAATSLQIELGQPADRADLAAAVLRELEADYRRLCQGEFEAIANEWEARCHTLGKNISVRLGTRVIEGRAESIDNDGLLLVRTRHGHLERITGGDVSLRA